MSAPSLLDERQTAARLSISHRTLQKMRVAGSPLPFVKLGNSVRYRPEDIEAFIAANLRSSTSDSGAARDA